MMQSHKTLLRHSFIAALCTASVACAMLQADLGSGFLLGFPTSKQGPVQPAIGLDGTLYGKFTLSKDIYVSFDDQLSSITGLGNKDTLPGSPIDPITGSSKRLPVYDQNVPSENYGGIDLSFRGLKLGYRNLLYGRSRRIDMNPSYYFADYYGVIDTTTFTYTFQYKRKMRHLFEGQYNFENDRIIADAALYHIITDGAIDTMVNASDYYNSQPLTTSATRIDMSGGLRVPEARMKFIGGGRALLDHSAPSEFNITDLYVIAGGDVAIDFHRLDYRLRTDYYSQGYLTDTAVKAHAITGLFQTLYLRSNISLGRAFMLKGLSVITFTGNLLKQRYEISLRKAWYNGSCIEGGASTTMGGLFPMVGYFIQSRIRPTDPLSISLHLKSLWDWPREDAGKKAIHAKTLFIKSIGEAEIAYRIGSAMECYLGGDLTYYNPKPTENKFPTRLFTGGGVRLYLP
jgi:hypothetical protein